MKRPGQKASPPRLSAKDSESRNRRQRLFVEAHSRQMPRGFLAGGAEELSYDLKGAFQTTSWFTVSDGKQPN